MQKILLTGSTGFIGSELLKDLSKDKRVYLTLRKKKIINLKVRTLLTFTLIIIEI